MSALILSDNSKVKFRPNHRNTFGLNFGLPSDGGTCPGATSGAGGCLDVRTGKKRETCYMAKIVQIYKAVGNVLQTNTNMLVGKSQEEMESTLKSTFQQFAENNEEKYWYFRLNYSGDVFSQSFANALTNSCKAFPKIKFWIYTRSFDYASTLVQAKNIAVYLSVDPVNLEKAYQVYQELRPTNNNIAMAHLGAATKLPDVRFVSCPETHGKVANTPARGACAACKLCFTYSENIKLRNIQFKIH